MELAASPSPFSIVKVVLPRFAFEMAFYYHYLISMILLMAEILHQLIGSLSHSLQGFIHPRWCRISAINSSNEHMQEDSAQISSVRSAVT